LNKTENLLYLPAMETVGVRKQHADILRAYGEVDIRIRSSGRMNGLNRFAEHQQGDQPDYQKNEEENLGDSHGGAGDASKTQQSSDDCND